MHLTREELEENIRILNENIDNAKKGSTEFDLCDLEEELSEFEQMLEELNNEED